jgi:hypothetical protein
MKERRSTQRYDLSLPVSVRVAAEKEGASWTAKTRNVSTGGIYFISSNELNTGVELDLTMTLPDEVTGGTEVFVAAIGKVVRVDKSSDDLSFGVAVAFEVRDILCNESA